MKTIEFSGLLCYNKRIDFHHVKIYGCRPTRALHAVFIDGFAKMPLQASIFASWYIQQNDFNFDCDFDIKPRDIVKLLGVEIAKADSDFADNFIRYIQLMIQYLGISLIAVYDLHCFFDKKELDLIFETLALNGVYVLCIEGTQPKSLSEYEKIHIIDQDLCEIE